MFARKTSLNTPKKWIMFHITMGKKSRLMAVADETDGRNFWLIPSLAGLTMNVQGLHINQLCMRYSANNIHICMYTHAHAPLSVIIFNI